MIDLHCHLLSGVDDGAPDLAATRASIERMIESGVTGFVVTPHVNTMELLRPSGAKRVAAALDEAWAAITEIGAAEFPQLTIRRGTELMLDHPSPDLSPDWVRLAGTRFVLIEFPGLMIPPRATEALAPLVADGYVPVMAHPERYRNASSDCAEAIAWRQTGARLQVNCGSLVGQYGTGATRRARLLLEHGVVDYLSSDYHTRGAYPVEASRKVLESAGAAEQTELLLCTNPARLLQNLDPIEVAPVSPPESPWRKLVGMRRIWSG